VIFPHSALGSVVAAGALELVLPGGTAVSATVDSGGKQYVYSGGITRHTVVSHGGSEVVSAGAVTSNTLDRGVVGYVGGAGSSTYVVSGGYEYLSAGGTAFHTTISQGGGVRVGVGGTASGTAVHGGGRLAVASGGTANNTVLSSGGVEIVSAGGMVGGYTTFGADAKLRVALKTGASLSISSFRATDTLDISNFGYSASEQLTFVENAKKTEGVLTITDGSLKATITLFGQYVAQGFHKAADGAGGTAITYAHPQAAQSDVIAAVHS
jgi:autotransporter passenger strand-loop-strand repeat protein